MAWLVPTSEGTLLVTRSGKCRLLLDKAAGGTDDWSVEQGFLCSPQLEIEISVEECVAAGPAIFPSQATLAPKPVRELQMGAKAATQQQDTTTAQLVCLQLDIQHQDTLAKKYVAKLEIKQRQLAELASRKQAAEAMLAALAAKRVKDTEALAEAERRATKRAMTDVDRASAAHIAAAQAKARVDAGKAEAPALAQAMAKAEAVQAKVKAAVNARPQAEAFDPEGQAEAVPDDVKAAAFKAQWTRSRRPL